MILIQNQYFMAQLGDRKCTLIKKKVHIFGSKGKDKN